MCIFTHLAAGALVGSWTGHAGAAAVAGLTSHAVLDLFPHYDFADWRVEVGLGAGLLALLIALPGGSLPAVVGGLAGCLPDLENLLWKLGSWERRRMIFPTHTGLLPHGAPRGPRNLWVQAVLAAACLAAIAVPAAAAAAAAPADPVGAAAPAVAVAAAATPARAPLMGAPRAVLLAEGEQATRLEARFPVEQAPADWATCDPERVRWREAGPVVRQADGTTRALPPRLSVVLAVPTLETPRVLLTDLVWWRQPGRAVAPEELLDVSGPGLFRGVPLVTIALRPLAPAGGILARATVIVEHRPAGQPAAALAAGRADGLDAGRPAVPTFAAGAALNAGLFARLAAGARGLREAAAKSAAASNHPFGLTTRWVRFEVRQTGVYRMSGYDLSLLGVPLAQVDPAKLRLYRGSGRELPADPTAPSTWEAGATGLTEVALAVEDQNGVWESADALLFYGVGGDAWADRFDPAAGRLEHYNHPYAAQGVYWLTWEDYQTASPLPGSPRRVTAQPAPSQPGGQDVTLHRRRLHLEQQVADVFARVQDHWGWDAHITGQREFPFDAGAVAADSSARFVADVRGYVTFASDAVDLNQASAWVNDDTGHAASATWTVRAQADSARVRLVGESAALVSGTNRLRVRNHRPPSTLDLIFDSFDVLYWAPLAKAAAGALEFAHWGDQVAAPGTPVNLRLTLPDAAPVTVWDVTDPNAPVALLGTAGGGAPATLTLGLVRDPGTARQLLAFDADDPLRPTLAARRNPLDLRGTLPAVDYVVIAEPGFLAAANELAALRGAKLPGVAAPAAAVVSEEAVYDNFSGGVKDPWALRNFLKWLYLRDGRAAYVCLVGDASRDYRNYLNRDPASQLYDWLPTVVRHYFPRNPSDYSYVPWASDDALVSFDAPAARQELDQPDMAVGRLTVRSVAEATAFVRRVRDYDLSPEPGPWRNRVVMAADDVWKGGYPSEPVHTDQAENLVDSYFSPTLDVDKVYLVDYGDQQQPSGYQPAARAAARQAWNDGLTIFHYIGHGSDNVLADEQLFLVDDIAGLSNGARRGVFLAFSCDVGVFDGYLSQSMAELFVNQPAGGAIAAIAAAQVSWIYSNDQLAQRFYAHLYPGRQVDPAVSLGRALLEAKQDMTFGELPNSQRYVLLGDPGLALPQPASTLSFAPDSADTLRGGARETVTVPLAGAGLAPGSEVTYDLRVEECRRDRNLLIIRERPPFDPVVLVDLDWWLPGATAYRGVGTVTDDPLRVSFKVPLQLAYGPKGRVRVMIETPDGAWAAARTVPVVVAATGPVSDVAGPSVDLAFADRRYRVPPAAPLTATIVDTSGVNILGTRPANSILFELDNSGFQSDVSRDFVFDAGSYTAGRVTVALPPDLALGRHTATLYASDVLGNVGSDTVGFVLEATAARGFRDVTVFPNPVDPRRDEVRLVFELTGPLFEAQESMPVVWEIYTVGGRRVHRQREVFTATGPQVLVWDGRDDEGDALANGVYLYVLRGAWPGDPAHEMVETGQIVIMK